MSEKCYINMGIILNGYGAMGRETEDVLNMINTFTVIRNDT